METAVKIAKQRLSVLELAEQLGSVSEDCRRRGMDRTSFYEWKRRFQTHGPAICQQICHLFMHPFYELFSWSHWMDLSTQPAEPS